MRSSKEIRGRARDMRDQPTAAELRLWKILRDESLGVKFRRQHPIGSYIVDFYCRECRLVIEVDGDTHTQPENIEYDKRRQEVLEHTGLHVLRFTNGEVLADLTGVLESIRVVVEKRKKEHPPLPPR